jgi:ATP phosphoribosyltransferase
MNLDLESFYTLVGWFRLDDDLVVRLVPDFFNQEIAAPVVTARVVDPVHIQDVEVALTRYQSESIVDIKATGSTLELWGEFDEVPLSISGREVRLTRSEYTSQDYQRVVTQLEHQLSSAHSESTRLRKHLHELEGFVVDLINRASAKRSMSSRDTSPSGAQLDVLSRVLRHIRDA